MDYLKKLPSISLPQSPRAATALQYFGAASLLYLGYKTWDFSSLWILPKKSLTAYQRPTRAWALVTGSSAGIGQGLTLELAARGFNVILLGHLPDELEQARQKLLTETPTADVKILVLNAATATTDEIAKSISSISHLPITILINNVGGVPIKPNMQDYDHNTPAQLDMMINLNARFMAQLTHTMLPVLKQNGPSLLINISSLGKLGFPGVAIYSGTKGFVSSLTQALKREAVASKWPIDIIAILPGDVQTSMNYKGLAPGTPSSREFAGAILDRVPRAVGRGTVELSPWFVHHVAWTVMGLVPEGVLMKAMNDAFEAKRKAYAEE